MTPLIEAAVEVGMRLTLISEAREKSSHVKIQEELEFALMVTRPEMPSPDSTRPLASGRVTFPQDLRIVPEADGWIPVGVERRLRLTNPDKPFFPDGETKGDLVAYYHSVAPVLLPHLRDRAIVLARFPDGADGEWFYEKQAPSHKPDWLPTALCGRDTAAMPSTS